MVMRRDVTPITKCANSPFQFGMQRDIREFETHEAIRADGDGGIFFEARELSQINLRIGDLWQSTFFAKTRRRSPR
jgi:hypothetical protein